MKSIQYAVEAVQEFNWAFFHFLRPKTLYLFAPLLLVSVLLIIGNKDRPAWKLAVAPLLRPFMFSKSSKSAFIVPLLTFLVAMSCAILSASGPTWRKKKVPEEKIQAVTLLAVDLSLSMLAQDLQPSRLERAKFKISDFLSTNPRTRTGLIAFAGTAHLVIPFTSDYKLIEFQAKALQNSIMPAQGTSIPALIMLVDSLVRHVDAPATILLMTDVLDADDASALADWIANTNCRLEILAFTTPGGARVPGHSKVISRQDPTMLSDLAHHNRITISPLTLDKSDVEGIAERIRSKLEFRNEKGREQKEWEDMGWLLILPALMVTVCSFRKGWKIQWCLFPILLTSMSACGVRSKHPDWWYTKDYQGQLWEKERDFEKASETFTDDRHRAVASFKAGNFETAAALFALDSTPQGHYNLGLAMANLGRYREAKAAFSYAARLDPELKMASGKSMNAVARAELRANAALHYDPTSVDKHIHSQAQKKHGRADSLKTRKPGSEDEELSSDTRVEKMPQSGERAADEVASSTHRYKESEKPDPNFKADKDQSAAKVLLRRARANPAVFLKKRFQLQVRRNGQHIPKTKTQW